MECMTYSSRLSNDDLQDVVNDLGATFIKLIDMKEKRLILLELDEDLPLMIDPEFL